MYRQQSVAATILPVFTVMAVGWAARRRGLLTWEFTTAASRLVFCIGLPALLFRVTADAPGRLIRTAAVVVTVLTVPAVFAVARGIAALCLQDGALRPTFVQSAFHCNVGLVGLAVAAISFGGSGLAAAALPAAWLILVQNILAVVVQRQTASKGMTSLFANPVILSCIAGTTVSRLELEIPMLMGRTLDVLGSLAIPLALLVIGASMRLGAPRKTALPLLAVHLLKLAFMPAIGLAALIALDLPPLSRAPAVILLASPTAVTVHTVAERMGGDPDFAAMAISTSTILSMVTLSAWLAVL